MSQASARLLILAAALLFSTGGAAIKACHLTSWQVASFRSGVAALALLVFMPAARKGLSPRILGVGVAYAACLTLFVAANKLTTAANTIFLQSTAPLYVLLLGPWLLREPVRRRDLGLTAVLAVGMALFFLGGERTQTTAPDPLRGNLLALVSGLCWALTVMGLRGAARGGGGAAGAAVLAGNTLAFLAGLPLALPVVGATGSDVLWLLYLGIFQIALAYVCVTAALRHIPALEASLLLLIEPVLNPIWAFAVHGERPGSWALLGGGIILAGTAWKALRP